MLKWIIGIGATAGAVFLLWRLWPEEEGEGEREYGEPGWGNGPGGGWEPEYPTPPPPGGEAKPPPNYISPQLPAPARRRGSPPGEPIMTVGARGEDRSILSAFNTNSMISRGALQMQPRPSGRISWAMVTPD